MAALKLAVRRGRDTTGSGAGARPPRRGRRRVCRTTVKSWRWCTDKFGMAMLQTTEVADPEYLELFDPITTLPTRLLFQDRCRVALDRARRRASDVGVIVITANDDAQIDQCARDAALRRIASGVISVLRGADTVARIDDETIVLLCNDLRRKDDLDGIRERLEEVLRLRDVTLRAFVVPASTDCPSMLRAIEGGELGRRAG